MKDEHKSGLIRYDAACRALAECHSVDEVKDIRDKALAFQIYAQQAKNLELERQAVEIRLRAERRAGEMLAEMKESGERRTKGQGKETSSASTLPDLGITRDQSSQWQQLAEIPEEKFEQILTDRTSMPSRAKVLGTVKPRKAEQESTADTAVARVAEIVQQLRTISNEIKALIPLKRRLSGTPNAVILHRLARQLAELTQNFTGMPPGKEGKTIDLQGRISS